MATDHPRSRGSRSSGSDPELIIAARAGDAAAFATLRHRHEAAALRLATLVVGPGEAAQTLTDRAFEQARSTLRSGGGPDCAFRLQILRDVRAAGAPAPDVPSDPDAHDEPDPVLRRSSQVLPDRWDSVRWHTGSGADPERQDGAEDDASRSGTAGSDARAQADPIVRTTFLALPERWGSVLWHTEVEGQSDADVAALLGMSVSTVDSLASRSRTGLVRGFLAGQEHRLDDPTCARLLERLGSPTRNEIADAQDPAPLEQVVRDATEQEHLQGCADCSAATRTVAVLTGDLGAALAIVVLGEQGIPYLQAVESAGGPTAPAAAAMTTGHRSTRLALVAVALVAVTAAIPALRAGAGSDTANDSLATAPLASSVDLVATTAPAGSDGVITPAGDPVAPTPGTVAGQAAGGGISAPTTSRTTITTTGANGMPTRIAVSATTSMGADGVPTTVAVVPGTSGRPATTVTAPFWPVFADSAGASPTDLSSPRATSTTGAAPGPGATNGSGPGAQPTGNVPSAVPPLSGDPTQTPAPTTARPGTDRPGTTAPATSVTATPTAATSTTDRPGEPGPTTPDPVEPDPGTNPVTTTAVSPPVEESTDTSTPSDEPTSSAPPAATPDIEVTGPTIWAVTLVGNIPFTSPLTLVNRTGAAIGTQPMTVTLPVGIDVVAEGAASGCVRQDDTTFECMVDALDASTDGHSVTLTLTGGSGSGQGWVSVSVTGNEARGSVVSVL